MLSVNMLTVIMLNVTYKPFVRNVVMLSVVAPQGTLQARINVIPDVNKNNAIQGAG
jgi:hypothetical protein